MLRDTCMTDPPSGQNAVSCHASTMWWLYKETHPQGTWLNFAEVVGNASERVSNLIQEYGKQRTNWVGNISVDQGSVLVFAENKISVAQGHSCVCGNDGRLHGSSQGGFFKCTHGVTGMCHHAPSEIDWTGPIKSHGCKVYTVTESQAVNWASRNL